MKYNSFYFLHIPKTGGRFLTAYVLEPLYEIFKKNNIKVLQIPDVLDEHGHFTPKRHGGWHKDIDENTYIVSIFREPIRFAASFYTHQVSTIEGFNGIKLQDMEYGTEELKNLQKNEHLDKEKFIDWISHHHYIFNMQCKNIILTVSDDKHIVDESGEYTRELHDNNKKLDRSTLFDRIKRINMFIRQEDLETMDYQVLADKILKDLGIEEKIVLPKPDMEYFRNFASSNLYETLNSDDMIRLLRYFKADDEVYSNKDLFWSTK